MAAPAIDAYRDQWADVELDASGFHFAPLPALARGDLDLVITADPVDEPGIHYFPLFSYEAKLAIAKDHELVTKEWLEPKHLADETGISYPVDRSRLDLFTSFLDPAGVEPEHIRHAELTTMIVQLVASGRGVACLPNWALSIYRMTIYLCCRLVKRAYGRHSMAPYAKIRLTLRLCWALLKWPKRFVLKIERYRAAELRAADLSFIVSGTNTVSCQRPSSRVYRLRSCRPLS